MFHSVCLFVSLPRFGAIVLLDQAPWSLLAVPIFPIPPPRQSHLWAASDPSFPCLHRGLDRQPAPTLESVLGSAPWKSPMLSSNTRGDQGRRHSFSDQSIEVAEKLWLEHKRGMPPKKILGCYFRILREIAVCCLSRVFLGKLELRVRRLLCFFVYPLSISLSSSFWIFF